MFVFKVDVLINSVGVSLNLRNGIVSQKLVEKAGKSVQDECKENYKNGINIGEIAITSKGDMICQQIFHVALYTNFVCDGNISTEVSLFGVSFNLTNIISTQANRPTIKV